MIRQEGPLPENKDREVPGIKRRTRERIRDKARRLLALENGTVFKDPGGRTSIALVYPNHYASAMSNLGFQTLYHIFNSMANVLAERAFLPEGEDMKWLEMGGPGLLTLESGRHMGEFDIIAFSLSFEDDYVNIPTILRLAGLPPLREVRPAGAPLVIAGGIAPSLNPWPIADFVDVFVIGEAEGAIEEFMERFWEVKGSGQARVEDGSKEALLRGLDSLDFTFVPSLYDVEYSGSRVLSMRPLPGAKKRVRARKNMDLGGLVMPRNFVRTPLAVFRDTSLMEIERGCGRGCRFCAAGFVCLPPRERPLEDVLEAVRAGASATGKVGLVGTAVSDYSALDTVVEAGLGAGATLTLSSMRLDVLTEKKLVLLKRAGYRTVTLAPEAGSERMRAVINKGITEDEILVAVAMVRGAGFRRMKFYFIYGLPTETDEDAEAIVDLVGKISRAGRGASIAVSLNPFVPKPFTPFQWSAFESVEVLYRRLAMIKKGVKGIGGVRLKAMPPGSALFQAYLARADARAGEVLMEAAELGPRRMARKRRAMLEETSTRERDPEEVLPWDIIDHGIKKDYLWGEFERAMAGRLTPPCAPGCRRCGVCVPGTNE